MTPVDWTDPRRAEAMRHCTEGRGPMYMPADEGLDLPTVAKLAACAIGMTLLACAMVIMLV